MTAFRSAASTPAPSSSSHAAQDAARKIGNYHGLGLLQARSTQTTGIPSIRFDGFALGLGLFSTIAFLGVLGWVYTFHHI